MIVSAEKQTNLRYLLRPKQSQRKPSSPHPAPVPCHAGECNAAPGAAGERFVSFGLLSSRAFSRFTTPTGRQSAAVLSLIRRAAAPPQQRRQPHSVHASPSVRLLYEKRTYTGGHMIEPSLALYGDAFERVDQHIQELLETFYMADCIPLYLSHES